MAIGIASLIGAGLDITAVTNQIYLKISQSKLPHVIEKRAAAAVGLRNMSLPVNLKRFLDTLKSLVSFPTC